MRVRVLSFKDRRDGAGIKLGTLTVRRKSRCEWGDVQPDRKYGELIDRNARRSGLAKLRKWCGEFSLLSEAIAA